DPAAERCQRAHVRSAEICRIRARRRAIDVSPMTVGFQTEHPRASLPIVTNLSAGQPTRSVMVGVYARGEILPARVAPGAATAQTDIKPGPIVDSDGSNGSFGI